MAHDPRTTRDGRTLTLADLKADMAQRANNSRILPPMDEEILALERANPIRIYSVSPRSWLVDTGLGPFLIPACREGEPHSLPLEIPAVIHEPIPTMDMKKMERRPTGGRKVALDIIGLGESMSPGKNLVKYGVFIAAQDTFDPKSWKEWVVNGKVGLEPTVKELANANKAVNDWDKYLVGEADALEFAGTRNEIGAEARSALLRLRAKGLDTKDRTWLTTEENMERCPGCQSFVPVGMAKHSVCGAIIDFRKARKLRLITQAELDEAIVDGLVPAEKKK